MMIRTPGESPNGNGGHFSRNAYNAIRKAKKVADMLVDHFAARIRELSDAGHNQTEISVILADEHLTHDQYGSLEILRTATSEAVRRILSPEEAAERRLQAQRDSLAGNTSAEGRAKGLRERNRIHGIHGNPLWTPVEEAALVDVVFANVHGPKSRYAGKPNWVVIKSVMHAKESLPKRSMSTYKQRYSLIVTAQNRMEEEGANAAG